MLAFNLSVAYRFAVRMQDPPLIVDRDMVELQKIEARPAVASINVEITDFWARLWANSFLLEKPQYFLTHTYEGRLNTALKGDWELTDGVIAVSAPTEADSVRIGRSFTLLNRHSWFYLRAELGEGWYPEERIARMFRRWHWSKGNATLVVDNPQSSARKINLRLSLRGLVRQTIQVWRGNQEEGSVSIGETLGERVLEGIVLPPGRTKLELRSSVLPAPARGRDERRLGFAAYGIELEVLPGNESATR